MSEVAGEYGGVEVRRARIEEIRALAAEYDREHRRELGSPAEAPVPPGGVFWLATDAADGAALGYAAGVLRSTGCTLGPVFTRATARRQGVGQALLASIQQWAQDTRVPVLEVSVAASNEAGRAFLASLGYEPHRVLMTRRTGPDRPNRS